MIMLTGRSAYRGLPVSPIRVPVSILPRRSAGTLGSTDYRHISQSSQPSPKCKSPQQAQPATGFFSVPVQSPRCQSRNATLRIAFAWLSVFIKTRCQPCSLIVAWSG